MQDGIYVKGLYLMAKKGRSRTVANANGKGLFGPKYHSILKNEQGYNFDCEYIKIKGAELVAPATLMEWNS